MISAYEFAVDIAAKGVQTPDQRLRRPSPKAKPDFVGTLDVWPWSYLIPYFKQDMNQRVGGIGLWILHIVVRNWHIPKPPPRLEAPTLSIPACLPACCPPHPFRRRWRRCVSLR